ncbi:MAG: hypothetical protein RCG15_08180 [Candidatus Rickettsia vulgarisii]
MEEWSAVMCSAYPTTWTLPSRMIDHPMAWLIEVNGFIIDIRQAPYDLQVEAFNVYTGRQEMFIAILRHSESSLTEGLEVILSQVIITILSFLNRMLL